MPPCALSREKVTAVTGVPTSIDDNDNGAQYLSRAGRQLREKTQDNKHTINIHSVVPFIPTFCICFVCGPACGWILGGARGRGWEWDCFGFGAGKSSK